VFESGYRSNTAFVRKEQKPETFQGYLREAQDMNAQDAGYVHQSLCISI
jgi:hypothetical protein